MNKLFTLILLLWCTWGAGMDSATAQTPTIIYIDSAMSASGTGTTWSTALKTVSEGLWLAHTVSGPVQLWIRKGTYFPMASATTKATRRDSSFVIHRNDIKVYGVFAGGESAVSARTVAANPTILSGDIGIAGDQTDNCGHVLRIVTYPVTTIDTATVLDGLTIAYGNADASVPDITVYSGYFINGSAGAGLYMIANGSGYTCSPLINNCTISNNNAYHGGGVACDGAGAVMQPLFSNCTFSNNSAGNIAGGVHDWFASVVYRNCTFRNNSASFAGGAIFHEGSKGNKLTMTSSFFADNTAQVGGAIRVELNAAILYAQGNIFYRNISTGDDGGALSLVMGAGTDTLINNLFVQNKALGSTSNGGGAVVQEYGTSSFIVNNTFYADTSGNNGGALHFKNGGTNRLFYNNIFYKSYNGSSARDTSLVAGTTITAQGNNTFSNTDPHFADESNFTGSDGLWGTADDGLRLTPCSHVINTGDNSRNLMSQDIAGNNRVFNTIIDPGAYELQLMPALHYYDTARISICSGDSVLFNGSYYKTALTHTDRFYTIGGCDSFKTLQLTINPLPAIPTVTTPVTYCVLAAASPLVASAGTDTLLWYTVPTGGTGSKTAPTPTTTSAGTTNYYVSAKSSLGCQSARVMITVQVNANATTPVVTTPINYCVAATSTALTATRGTGTDTLLWYTAATGGTGSKTAPTPATTSAGSTNYYVSAKSNLGCESARAMITVQVNANATAPVVITPVAYCVAATPAALTATRGTGTDTLLWYTVATGGTGSKTAPTPVTTSAGTTNYYVSAKSVLGCEGARTKLAVIVQPLANTPVVSSPVDYCLGATATALVATPGSATDTLLWYTVASGGTPGRAAPIPATVAVGAQTYYVSGKTNQGCEGSRAAIEVDVHPFPAAPVVTSPLGICMGASTDALVATGSNLLWYTLALGGSGSTVAPVPSSALLGTTTWYVSQTSSFGCESARSALLVQVNPVPSVDIVPAAAPDFAFCSGGSVTVKAIAATATSYEWHRDGALISGVTADTLVVNTNAAYSVVVTNMYGCTGADSAYVFKDTLQHPVLSPGDLQFCAGYNVMLYCTPASAGYRYSWFQNGIDMGLAPDATMCVINSSGIYYVQVTDYYGCTSLTKSISASLYPAVIKPVILHTGASLRLNHAYSSYQWYRNAKEIIGANSISFTPAFDGAYYATVFDENGCGSVSDTVTVAGLAIGEPDNTQHQLKLYPNPTQGMVQVAALLPVNVTVKDITGRVLLTVPHAQQIDLQGYVDGMYIFVISDDNDQVIDIEKVYKTSVQ